MNLEKMECMLLCCLIPSQPFSLSCCMNNYEHISCVLFFWSGLCSNNWCALSYSVFVVCTALSGKLAIGMFVITPLPLISAQKYVYFLHTKSCRAGALSWYEIRLQVRSNKIDFALISGSVCIKLPFQFGLLVWLYHHTMNVATVPSPENVAFLERNSPCSVGSMHCVFYTGACMTWRAMPWW